MMPYLRRSGYAADNGVFYLLQDHLHSSSGLITEAGALSGGYAYYAPFGASRSGQVALTQKRFTGQYHETSLPGGAGLYDYGARWYDARIGRFVSPDSLVPNPANPQDLNRYSYVRNNPLKYTDPTGHSSVSTNRSAKKPGALTQPARPRPTPAPSLAGGYQSSRSWKPALSGAQLSLVKVYSDTYGVPWQITAGLLEAEIHLDTNIKDSYENWFVYLVPQLAEIRDVGPGIGNVHLSTAYRASEYFATNYGSNAALQLGYGNLTKTQLADEMLYDDGNIRTVAATVRMLADYRFGVNGQPALGPHANLRTWSGVDAVMVWHCYRYGVPEPVSPGGQGFPNVNAYQNRGVGVRAMSISGSGATASIQGSYPMFRYYFRQP